MVHPSLMSHILFAAIMESELIGNLKRGTMMLP